MAVYVGTILVIITLAVLPLLTPWFIHAALDAGGSAAWLRVDTADAHALSDRSVEELVLGPGTFAISDVDGSAFYDQQERSHLRDARVLLWSLLVAGGLSLILTGAIYARAATPARITMWLTISRAGLTTSAVIVVLGLVSVVAFATVFTLFHQIFFPAGNFTFDPDRQRLVQLYPFRFWQIAAGALAILLLLLSLVTWWLGRWRARTLEEATRR